MLDCQLFSLLIQAKYIDQLLEDLEAIAPGFGQFAEVLKEHYVSALALSSLTTEQLQEFEVPEGAAIIIAAYYKNRAGVSWRSAL